MFNHRIDSAHNRIVVFHWCLLTFNAGCINAGGFLATGRFVSHVTGFATLFGVDLVKSDYEAAAGILSVPLFFLLGSFLAGILIDRPIAQNRKPHFDLIMGLSGFCLFGAALGGHIAHAGGFGESLKLSEVYYLLSLLCLACGLQNGAITASSGSSIRTTHLTGLTTDLGLGIARLFSYGRKTEKFQKEFTINSLRVSAIVAFVVGSGAGAWVFLTYGYAGFGLSGLIALYAAWHGRKSKLAFTPSASS